MNVSTCFSTSYAAYNYWDFMSTTSTLNTKQFESQRDFFANMALLSTAGKNDVAKAVEAEALNRSDSRKRITLRPWELGFMFLRGSNIRPRPASAWSPTYIRFTSLDECMQFFKYEQSGSAFRILKNEPHGVRNSRNSGSYDQDR